MRRNRDEQLGLRFERWGVIRIQPNPARDPTSLIKGGNLECACVCTYVRLRKETIRHRKLCRVVI